MNIAHLMDWFTGNGRYMTLFHCMGHDTFWITITVVLDLLVATGYVLIALHWWDNQRLLAESPAKRALGAMRNIFIFCGICGYLFIPVKMFWPAWRLYDIVIIFLVYFTWRYALSAKNLGVVYKELSLSATLAKDLAESQAEAKRKGFFLNAISHDLRTPLNGLILQVELAQLSSESNDSETLAHSLEEIKASAKATAALLNSFLEIGQLDSSGEANHLSVFKFEEFCENVIQVNMFMAEQAKLKLECGKIPADLWVRTDRIKLERVLMNLVSNGLKFTPAGRVEIGVELRNGNVSLYVADTGIGISARDQPFLFDEFFQIGNNERDRRKGFGLGLAIARRLVEQLGGSLRVESEVGRGSRFSVDLPGVAVPQTTESRYVSGPVAATA